MVGYTKDNRLIVVPMLCKSWACPRCRGGKLLYWFNLVKAAQPTRLITLSCNQNSTDTPANSFDVMTKAWTVFVRKVRAKFGKDFQFLKSWELHKSGFPHLHIIAKGQKYIPQHWISTTWEALGGGRVVHISRCKSAASSIGYLTRHMDKDLARTCRAFPGRRLISVSRGFVTPQQRVAAKFSRDDVTHWTAIRETSFQSMLDQLLASNSAVLSFNPNTSSLLMTLPRVPFPALEGFLASLPSDSLACILARGPPGPTSLVALPGINQSSSERNNADRPQTKKLFHVPLELTHSDGTAVRPLT